MGRKKGSVNVSIELCNTISDAVTMGVTVTDVAKYNEMPQPTVSNIVKRVTLRRTGILPKRRGRRNKLDLIALKCLELILVQNRFLLLNTIAAIFNANSTISISPRRIRRYIHIIGFRNRAAIRKPFIREANLLRRTAWAFRHCYWNMFMWSRVVFTDETSFEVRPMKRNIRVWRMNGERFGTSCIISTYKSGYELVNVWGVFSHHGKLPLQRSEGSFTKQKYLEICEYTLLPWAALVYGNVRNLVLQEDNCGPHRAVALRNYMNEGRVTRMDWPAQSPVLNTIENAWSYMKSYFRKQPRHPKNKDECWNNVTKLWSELSLSYFHNLIGSMATRIQEILEKNGGSTKY